jgi:hypothetical protein
MKIEPAKSWTIGRQVVADRDGNSAPGHEEEVGTNWWDAAGRLLELANQWALDDDRARGVADNRGQTGKAIGWAWHRSPPVFDCEASYDIEAHDGTIHRLYLAGEQP